MIVISPFNIIIPIIKADISVYINRRYWINPDLVNTNQDNPNVLAASNDSNITTTSSNTHTIPSIPPFYTPPSTRDVDGMDYLRAGIAREVAQETAEEAAAARKAMKAKAVAADNSVIAESYRSPMITADGSVIAESSRAGAERERASAERAITAVETAIAAEMEELPKSWDINK